MNCKLFTRLPHFIVTFWRVPRPTNLTWNVSRNIIENIAFILAYSTLFWKFIWLSLCFFCMIFNNSLNTCSLMLPEKLFAEPLCSMFRGILAKACIFGKFHPQPSSLGKHSFIRLMRSPRTLEEWCTFDRGCGSFTQRSNDRYSFRQCLNLFMEIFLSFISFHINFCSKCVCITQNNSKQLLTLLEPQFW